MCVLNLFFEFVINRMHKIWRNISTFGISNLEEVLKFSILYTLQIWLLYVKGTMIKKIGTNARIEIEEMLEKKVYLDLRVKVIPNWRDKDSFLNEQLGYKDFNEKSPS